MKINNYLITSIPCLQRHFDCEKILRSVNTFIRDLSPCNIPYPDERCESLYDVIAHPEKWILADGAFRSEGALLELQFNKMETLKKLFETPSGEDLRKIALFELVEKELTEESAIPRGIRVDPLTGVVTITGGLRLDAERNLPNGALLEYRIIRVEKEALPAVVDDVEIPSGGVACGLFYGDSLYQLLPFRMRNTHYNLRLKVAPEGVGLCVRNLKYNTEMTLKGVYSFATVGDEGYLYVERGCLLCNVNSEMEAQLRRHIAYSDRLMAVELEEDVLVATMQDATKKRIELKL